jgi:hypothetical protein
MISKILCTCDSWKTREIVFVIFKTCCLKEGGLRSLAHEWTAERLAGIKHVPFITYHAVWPYFFEAFELNNVAKKYGQTAWYVINGTCLMPASLSAVHSCASDRNPPSFRQQVLNITNTISRVFHESQVHRIFEIITKKVLFFGIIPTSSLWYFSECKHKKNPASWT